MRGLLRTLGLGLALLIGRRSAPDQWQRPAGHWWGLLLPLVGLSILMDYHDAGTVASFSWHGLYADALLVLAVLAAAALLATAAGRPADTWSAASLLLSALLGVGLAGWVVAGAMGSASSATEGMQRTIWIVQGTLLILASWTLAGAMQPNWPPGSRWLVAAVAGALVWGPTASPSAPAYWYAEEAAATVEQTPRQPPFGAYRGDAEALMHAQAARVDQAVAALAPGRPGVIDAYVLAFGGDAGEDVFRNEVEYALELFARRFAAAGRTLGLLNHPDTTARFPIASRSTLRQALAGIARRMDREEDLLLLYLTAHGRKDHALELVFDPLPLNPLTPADLRAALDDAGIRWRVVIISACYSGGFIDALAEPGTLVISAARADRPSFGCGVDSEITYFGQALLVEALNREQRWPEAFALARAAVTAREQAEGFELSEPQISLGAEIAPRLARWSAALPPAPAVAFVPAAPVSACREDRERCR
jgi:hypothetical protein